MLPWGTILVSDEPAGQPKPIGQSPSTHGGPRDQTAGNDDPVGLVAVRADPLHPDTTTDQVDQMFRADPDLEALAIVDAGRPIGLITRFRLANILSRGYGRDLFAHRPILRLMDANPLIVEADVPVTELESLIATERPSALLEGFVIVRQGRYLGIGTALSLLRHTVSRHGARTLEIEEARRQAEEASLAKSRFLAAMSHELRTPLNAIIGFSEIIAGEMFGPASDRYPIYARDINESATHLLSLINDILDMSRIEAGQDSIREVTFDPEALVRASLRMVADYAREKGVMLHQEFDLNGAYLLADERGVRQIVLNLVSNSLKFTAPGGRVTARVVARDGSGLSLAVADTGCGMSEEEIELALRPFGRVENAWTRTEDGFGLGLPIVVKIADVHGCRFHIQSTVGRGTTITVEFPASRVVRPDGSAGVDSLGAASTRAASPEARTREPDSHQGAVRRGMAGD